MEIKQLKCSNCSANLVLHNGIIECQYCNTLYATNDEITTHTTHVPITIHEMANRIMKLSTIGISLNG